MDKEASRDPYQTYYDGNFLGQQSPSKSMKRLSRFFKSNNVKRILDFYCGAGRNSIFLSNQGFELTGFDGSKMAIEKAIEGQRKAKSSASFQIFNYQHALPYEDGYYDAVIAVRAIYQANIQRIREDIEEIRRVTRLRGYLYLESDQRIIWSQRKYWGQSRTSERGTYIHKDGSYYHYFTERELRTFFKGYRIVRFYFNDRKFYVLYQKIESQDC